MAMIRGRRNDFCRGSTSKRRLFLLPLLSSIVVAGNVVSLLSVCDAFIVETQQMRKASSVAIGASRRTSGRRPNRVSARNSSCTGIHSVNNINNSADVSDCDVDDKKKPTNNDLLLEKARLLREEARVEEDNLRSRRSRRSKKSASTLAATSTCSPVVAVAENTQLENSVWTVSYRFSSQPIPKDDDMSSTSPPQQQREQQALLSTAVNKFYSGKINLRLKEDGYSEQMPETNDGGNEKNNNPTNNNSIEIVKIWGWDREISNEDNLEYLLFSMDIKLPRSDPTTESSNQIVRFYFQAQIIEQNNTKGDVVLTLKDGTITVKKDVTEKTNGMWGLFNVAGILTEFKYCGDFIAKPSSVTAE